MTPELRDCNGCGAKPGERHDGCDIARCVSTGGQWIQCPGEEHEHNGRIYGEHDGPCREDIWTGEYPGAAECREYGFWCYFVPSLGFVPCEPDHPDASEDMNRLYTECVWDRDQQKMVRRVAR